MAKRDRKEQDRNQVDRRGFMKLAGLGAGAAGATMGLALPKAEAATPAPATEHAGYSETEHVKTYYRMARF